VNRGAGRAKARSMASSRVGRGWVLVVLGLGGAAAGSASACGARTELGVESFTGGAPTTTTTTTGCVEGATMPCGSDVGACMYGTQTCHDGVFGACVGGVGPRPEACTGLDENCNGTVNDCDPGSGTCTPSLFVVGSTPSSPSCIDFPVTMGATGSFTYTCPGTGGIVTADLGGIDFTGTVTNNHVSLDAITTIGPPQTPDGCTWQDHHHIEGDIQSLTLTYSYSEMVIEKPAGPCWSPCTETGTVQISFPMGG
jgi:hypothetical protein